MLKKLFLYGNTIIKMKPSQIYARIRKTLGMKNTLGVHSAEWHGQISFFQPAEELDFDPVFLSRFDAEEFRKGKVTFLHESEKVDWDGDWKVSGRASLWNFNLHYFEYLMTFVHAYKMKHENKYLTAIESCIDGWINNNPAIRKGDGWEPYTISLRLVYWFSCYFYLGNDLNTKFKEHMIASMHEQYVYLANHLEKDLLANHYFENLKALILCAIAFQDERMLQKTLTEFKEQCKEQIMPDGMHFELSPMYHKIVLEALLRTAVALRSVGKKDAEIEHYIQPMIDVAFSLEEGLERIPLFNDGGNNVAKSLDSLLCATQNHFGLKAVFKHKLQASGFYIFKWGHWKMIVDAGQPGPSYNAGHSQCDAMSFELFFDGKPMIVNCGTYAYQCKDRLFFRNTEAHNTVMIEGVQQSQIWGLFRLGRESKTRVLFLDGKSIIMEMTDQKNQKIQRKITTMIDGISIEDNTKGKDILSYVHYIKDMNNIEIKKGSIEIFKDPYASEYGKKIAINSLEIASYETIKYRIRAGHKQIAQRLVVKAGRMIYHGYKPLAFLNGKIYLYKDGQIWAERNGSIKPVLGFENLTWKDRNRLFIRVFRSEPKQAIPIDDNRLLLCSHRKMILADISTKDVLVIGTSRTGFSDPLNICKAEKKWIALWGDYGPNNDHESVYIYGLTKDLEVKKIYEFKPGQVRHIHNIIKKYSGGYYIFTGDQEETAGIYIADEEFQNVVPMKIGNQKYRTVVGFDTPKGLLYATDAINEDNYIYLLKNNDEPSIVCDMNGSCIYGTNIKNQYFFSTTVEPDENKHGMISWISRKRGAGIKSNDVMVMMVDDRLHYKVIARYKKDIWPMKLMQYGTIQFPHGEGDELWMYPIAIKKWDGCAIKKQ